MIRTGRICEIKHNPPYSYGDCVKACIDSLLDRDDTPHVFDARPSEESWKLMREHLATLKKTIALFAIDDHAEWMTSVNPGVPYLLFHRCGEGNHVVICKDGKKYHDPSWGPAGIDGPVPEIGAYIVGILGDLI